MNYYKNELKKLKHSKDYMKTIQITDYEGNKTKCLDINLNCIDVLIDYLISERKRIVKTIIGDK